MPRAGIGTRLVAQNVGLVVLAAAGVAFAAQVLLGRLASDQALARVAAAGASAREAVAARGQDLALKARVLAERPTLDRLLDDDDPSALAGYLDKFRRGIGASACAVVDGARVKGDLGGVSLPASSMGPSLVSDGAGIAIVAGAAIPGRSGMAAVVVERLDGALVAAISSEVGVPVVVVTRGAALEGYGSGHAALLSRVIAEGRRDAIRVDDIGAYCDVEPMLLDSGQVGAALEARLPTASVDRTLRRLRSWLGGLTILVALAVALASALAARRVAAPIDALTTAAARLGGGDLDTAVAAVGFAEVATLGRVMDEMRERLRGLTTALRQRETERTAVLEGISEGVLAVDAQRRVRYLNPQAARMLGVAPDEAIGRECGDLLHPRLAPHERPCEERCPIVLARSSGVARATERLALEPARTTVVMSAAPHGDQQVVLLRDETEAEAGRRMRDAILASLSHELRTPLAAQLASIEMLRDRVAAGDATEIDPLVTSLERGTLRLTRLIDNLLESARIEAGYGAMRAQEVRIDEVVEEAIQQTAPLIHQRGQVLDVDLPFPVPLVKGDEQRLVQVVGNLLANAQKYAPDGATISLRVTADDRSMELRVDNPGPPLPQQAGDLFQPFVRARGAEPVQPGVGLGLWVVRSIVERHGGKVCALNVQGGVRFAVSLPRMAPAAPKIEP